MLEADLDYHPHDLGNKPPEGNGTGRELSAAQESLKEQRRRVADTWKGPCSPGLHLPCTPWGTKSHTTTVCPAREVTHEEVPQLSPDTAGRVHEDSPEFRDGT